MGFFCSDPVLARMTSREPMWSDPSLPVGRVLENGKVVATWQANTDGEVATVIEAAPGSPIGRPPMRVVLVKSAPGLSITGAPQRARWHVRVDGASNSQPYAEIRDERDARTYCTWHALAAFLGERYTDRTHPGMELFKAMRFFTPPNYNRESARPCP